MFIVKLASYKFKQTFSSETEYGYFLLPKTSGLHVHFWLTESL